MDVSGAAAAVAGTHGRALASMPFGDRRDFMNAQRGFMGRREPGAIHEAENVGF